jgi:acyl-CoA synthetase (NDP forming)
MIATARKGGRDALLEPEGFALLRELGFPVPRHVFGSDSAPPNDLSTLTTAQVVVKVVAPDLLHKTDVGGIAVVINNPDEIASAMYGMKRRLTTARVLGFIVQELLPYQRALGHELLLGARWTGDFGPVVALGAGGVHAELLSSHLRAGADVAVFSAAAAPADLERSVSRTAVGELATKGIRGQPPPGDPQRLMECVDRVRQLAASFMPHDIREFEINPLVAHDGDWYAVDVLVKLGDGKVAEAPARPLHKMKQLLQPQSIAIIGVSKRMNPGHVILNNLVNDGFDRDNIFVVKPGLESIEGCRCYPSVADLPQRVDLLVLSVDAAQVPDAVSNVIENERADSIIITTGGLEEKSGSEEKVTRTREVIDASRRSDWQGPLINGGNSLGIESLPGGYNTIFIPRHKLGTDPVDETPVAFISQSGAFAIAKQSKLRTIRPRYTISIGNQTDVTVGDYLSYLKDDGELRVFAAYVEGFRLLDGLRFLDAAREITAGGGTVILYRAGRTKAGARATASHTASIAGDFAVTRALAHNAGVLVAETLEDFEDLTMLSCLLQNKTVSGRRLGALSNAGFECVAIADNLFGFQLAQFGRDTRQKLEEVLKIKHLDAVVDVHNPMDLTPITGDAGYETAIRAILTDDNVDLAVVGCVPLTPALNTLSPDPAHHENVKEDGAVAGRLARAFAETRKPLVAVVDAGAIYDAMASTLQRSGVPTFRSADRAMRIFDCYCNSRLRGS